MKSILVITDFSEAAHNAARYGAALARSFNAKLFLFHAYLQLPVPYAETPVIISAEDMRNMVSHKLEEEANAIRVKEKISPETACEEGPVAEMILREAKKRNADLIIAGTKTRGKGVRKIFGSTVTALERKTTVPLVVIPEGTVFARIKTIALASEGDIAPDADKQLLSTLIEIGEKFHSKLYLVHIVKNDFKAAFAVLNQPSRLTQMTKSLDPQYKTIPGKGISPALNEFITAYGINMIAMLPHQYSLAGSWLTKSATRSMIFESRIPLLILPDVYAGKIRQVRSRKEILV